MASLDPTTTPGVTPGFDSSELSFITSRYPQANDLSQGDGVNTAGYRFTFPRPDDRITYVGRIDYNLTETQKIFGRFTIDRRNAIEVAPEFKTDPVTHPLSITATRYIVSHVWNIGKNKVNQFYYGDTISKLTFLTCTTRPGPINTVLRPQTALTRAYDGQKRRVPIPVVRDDFNWQHGEHSLTMGGTVSNSSRQQRFDQ